MTECREIKQHFEAGILQLELNRPGKKNALTGEMYRHLCAALEDADNEPQVKVVLVTAVGDCFCAGNDIHGFRNIAQIPYTERPGFAFMNTVARFRKPLVAAVQGDAVGIGATFLLHCDLVYLSHHARLRFPFIDLGIVPEFASTLILPRKLGHQKTAELLFLDQELEAPEALRLGLVNQVCDIKSLLALASKNCKSLCEKNADALQRTKALLKDTGTPSIGAKIESETLAINQLLETMTLPGKRAD